MTTQTSTGSSTTDATAGTAATAAEEGRHVAGVATDQAKGVAGEAVQQARGVVDDAMGQVRGQLDDQGRQQKDRLAGTLAMLGDDLDRMSRSGSGLAAELALEAADRVRAISRHLDQREPRELLDDVRRFARQRPGTFLLGALAAGVVVGRLARGTKDAVEAAGAQRATPGAPTAGDGYAGPDLPAAGATGAPVSSTGYASPPPATGLPGTPDRAMSGPLS